MLSNKHLLPQIQRRVEECEASRARLEERREGRQLETYQRRQHKLKLRQQAKVLSFGSDHAYCIVMTCCVKVLVL